MANSDDIENGPSSSTCSKEKDAEKLQSANNLINELQATTDLLSSYVKESTSYFSCPDPAATNSNNAENFLNKSSASCSNISSTERKIIGFDDSLNNLNHFDDIVVPVLGDWEENANDKSSNVIFCFKISPESEESITKTTCMKYNSPSNKTLKDYSVDEDTGTEHATTSKHIDEKEMSNSSAKIEATISTMEREIHTQHKKSKLLLNLHPETLPDCPNQCESEIMGDDATKNTIHIICECDQPGVSGAAVPVITSFTFPDDSEIENKKNNNTDELSKTSERHLISEVPKVSKKNICSNADSAASLKKVASKQDKSKIRAENEEQKRRYRKLTEELSAHVSQLAIEASNLTKIENPSAQSIAIDTIFKYVKSLNQITNELKAMQIRKEATDTDLSQNSTSKIKDGIFMKFLSNICGAKKGQNCDCNVRNNNKPKSRKVADVLKNSVESMDGIFIPSFNDEPPPSLENDIDEEGSGIADKPEKQNLNENGSHVSECFADASSSPEFLKRCPKTHTLNMAQRKLDFQSVNNVAIVPDSKVTECMIDHKKSDMLCILLPKECLYPSQLIPVVEGTAGTTDSFKLSGSTDSELLNIAGLPSANRNKRKLLMKSCSSVIQSDIQKIVSAVDEWPDQRTSSLLQIPGLLTNYCRTKLLSRATSKQNSI